MEIAIVILLAVVFLGLSSYADKVTDDDEKERKRRDDTTD